jgi:hypothetical protein
MIEFCQFIKAVFSKWVALLSGIASIATSIILDHVRDHPALSGTIAHGLLWSFASACLVVAFFLVWRTENRRANKAEQPKYSQKIAEFVRSETLKASPNNQRVLDHLAMGGRISWSDAHYDFGTDPARGLSDVSAILRTDGLESENIHRIYYSIDPAYLDAVRDYFIANPLPPKQDGEKPGTMP